MTVPARDDPSVDPPRVPRTRPGQHATALFVLFDDPDLVRRTVLAGMDAAALPFSVLIDHDRRTYRSWGLSHAPWWTIWLDPNVYRQYWQLLRAGDRIRAVGRDVLQLGGDFVIAPDGTVAYARPQQRDDRPPVGELLQVVEALRVARRD